MTVRSLELADAVVDVAMLHVAILVADVRARSLNIFFQALFAKDDSVIAPLTPNR